MTVGSLVDGHGREVARYEIVARARRADVIATDGAAADAIAAAIESRLAGHRVSVIDRHDVADSLVAHGAEPSRHLAIMTVAAGSVGTAPPHDTAPGGITIRPMVVDHVAQYGALVTRAYPPGHPDHDPADDDPEAAARTVEGLLRGEQVGPWLPGASFEAVDDAGVVVGAIVASAMPPSLSYPGSAWITEIVVEPASAGRGIGGLLIRRAAAGSATGGHGMLGLAVTVGNPARRLYESLGFAAAMDVRQVRVPALDLAGDA